MADNTIIAAHLAAALILKSEMKQFTPEQAVERYRSVLKLLNDDDARANQESVDGWLGALKDETSRP
jgi:hypothetical protein